MDPSIKVAFISGIVALVTSSIVSIFAPWASWGVEKRKQKLLRRRELINEWRNMNGWAVFGYEHRVPEDYDLNFVRVLERTNEYSSLRPHLSAAAIETLTSARKKPAGDPVEDMAKQKLSAEDQELVFYLMDEVARIEKEWKLV